MDREKSATSASARADFLLSLERVMIGQGTKGTGFIVVRGLQLQVRVGVPDAERAVPQRLLLDLEIEPVRPFSSMNDDLAATVDYAEICRKLRRLTAEGSWRLIETLAADVRQLLLEQPNVEAARVRVRKFILPDTEYVAVEL